MFPVVGTGFVPARAGSQDIVPVPIETESVCVSEAECVDHGFNCLV